MGEIAALLTSLCWSLTSVQFTLAGRRLGSGVVNRIRLVLAALFLAAVHLLLYGKLLPLDAEPFRWGWLGLSGTAGLVLGDASLFQSFVLIGPRRGALLMTLVPVISTLLAWGWLGETLSLIEIGAMFLAIGGIAWVVSERQLETEGRTEGPGRYGVGILLGAGGALGQASGLVLAKQGLVGDFPSLSAALIRMVTAVVVIWAFTLVQGRVKAVLGALGDRKALGHVVGGALTGPFAGVWLSMVAVQHAPVGVASTLMAMSPIMLIPLSYWVFRERVGLRAVAGTAVALVGAAVIFLT
jgi:drug/metabolite transporter (DMT)-like permease